MDSYYSYNTIYSSIIVYRKRKIIVNIPRGNGLMRKLYAYAVKCTCTSMCTFVIMGMMVIEFHFFNLKEKNYNIAFSLISHIICDTISPILD